MRGLAIVLILYAYFLGYLHGRGPAPTRDFWRKKR